MSTIGVSFRPLDMVFQHEELRPMRILFSFRAVAGHRFRWAGCLIVCLLATATWAEERTGRTSGAAEPSWRAHVHYTSAACRLFSTREGFGIRRMRCPGVAEWCLAGSERKFPDFGQPVRTASRWYDDGRLTEGTKPRSTTKGRADDPERAPALRQEQQMADPAPTETPCYGWPRWGESRILGFFTNSAW